MEELRRSRIWQIRPWVRRVEVTCANRPGGRSHAAIAAKVAGRGIVTLALVTAHVVRRPTRPASSSGPLTLQGSRRAFDYDWSYDWSPSHDHSSRRGGSGRQRPAAVVVRILLSRLRQFLRAFVFSLGLSLLRGSLAELLRGSPVAFRAGASVAPSVGI